MGQETNSSGKPRISRRSNQMIIEQIAEYKKSQSTVKEFCESKGIKSGTFYNWLNKYRSKEQQTYPAFVPVTITDDEPSDTNLVAEYKGLKFYQPLSVEFLKL